ncbi:MAG: alpha/beta hydrolase-fold protein, partial [Bacteroidota bacterium]
HIKKSYRTNGFEILCGHSFGGLAAINTFVSHPDFYNAYIAIDPSMWWDNQSIIDQMDRPWISDAHKGRLLFVAKANDPGSGDDHHNALLALNQKLIDFDNQANYKWKYEFYDMEDHGSVVVPAEYNALRFLFKGYQMPVKKAMKDPSLLMQHFEVISKRLGYQVIPDEALIDELAKVCIRREFFEQAKQLLMLNTKNYPKSVHADERYKTFIKEYDIQLKN